MKSRLLYLFTSIGVLFFNALPAQCPTGNVTFISQADVNSFAEKYPNCTTINGNMTIGNSSANNIADLSPLANITSVSGFIKIDNSDFLTTLSDLGNITSVGDLIYIYGCDALTSLEGLNNLTSVGNLSISGNDALTSLTGLDNLTSVGGFLIIKQNSALTSFAGLDNLVSVGGFLSVTDSDALISFAGLDNLTFVGGFITIKRNDALTSLSALKKLTYAKTYLEIIENTALTSLQGIHNIEMGDIINLEISKNPNLSICDMPNICTYLESNKRNFISGNREGCSTKGQIQSACLPEVVSITTPANFITECGIPLLETDLPATLTVTFDDNTSGQVAVNWDVIDIDGHGGSHTLTGTLDLMGQATNPDNLTAKLTVVVEDTQAPISDIADLPVLRGMCSVTISDIPTATDVCTGTVSATTNDPLQYDNQGTYTITWSYSDGHGNFVTQEQIVIVEVMAKPILLCPESYIVSCDPVVHFDLPVANDQCGAIRVIQTDNTGLTSGSAFPTGVTKLTYQASNAAGPAYCSIVVEILPPRLEINHVSGVANGDTIHLADCLPPHISRDDLDLGPHQKRSSVLSRKLTEENTSFNQYGMWKVLSYEYEVTNYCGSTEAFQNYVALYDLSPPIFQYFPRDVTIASADDLPPVSEEVTIIDICRYVVWDTITTTPIVDSGNGDTLVYVRRWMAEDESGNKSFRDQMIYVAPNKSEAFGAITAHMAKESDLVHARFSNMEGTNGVPVTLFRVDSITGSTTRVNSRISGNWQGQYGKVFFTPIQSGQYRLKVDLPMGYTVVHADSLFTQDGWSDILYVKSNSKLNLGTILLLPVQDTVKVDTVLPQVVPNVNTISRHESTFETFTLHPNPTTGSVKINSLQSGRFDYTIYNHLGQLVKSGSSDHGNEIDLSNQLNGMYFIHVRSGKQDWGSRRILLMGG